MANSLTFLACFEAARTSPMPVCRQKQIAAKSPHALTQLHDSKSYRHDREITLEKLVSAGQGANVTKVRSASRVSACHERSIQAALCQSYRLCKPPTCGKETKRVYSLGLKDTARIVGVSFSKESWFAPHGKKRRNPGSNDADDAR